MRRALLATVGALAIVACVGALVLRFTPLMDGAFNQVTGRVGNAELARRYHRGDRPCLRYRLKVARPQDVEALAEALVDAGVAPDRLGELVYLFVGWQERDEAAAHERSEPDELADAMIESATPMQRPLVALKRERFRQMVEASLRPRPSRPVAALSAAEQALFEPVWRDHPEVLLVAGMVEVLKKMRVRLTGQRLDALAAFVGNGSMRDGFDDRKVPVALMKDGYDLTIHTDVWGDQLRLISYGADAMPGGTGDDADQMRVVALGDAVGAPQPTAEDALAVSEGAPPAPKVTILRSDVDAALANIDALSKQAKVVPAMSGGKVIGFKLLRIHQRSLYQRVGLEPGDVVTAVEGYPLSEPDKALEVYSKVRDATALTLSILREDKPYTIRVEIKR